MKHSLGQKVKARKAMAAIVGNIKAKVETQHRLAMSFSVTPPARNNSQKYTKMCVISPHNYAGIVSHVVSNYQVLYPAPNDMFEFNELCFNIDRLVRSYDVQKLLKRREILSCM